MNKSIERRTGNDEIDFLEFLNAIWRGKWFVIIFTTSVTAITIAYAMSLPDVYKSEVTLVAAGSSNLKMPSQMSGLAALAGVNLGNNGSDKTTLAIQILKSRHFMGKFIEANDLYIAIVAAKSWNRADNSLVINPEVYDVSTGKWLRKVNPPFTAKPSIQETVEIFSDSIKVDEDKTNGMITISLKHYSPMLAKSWLDNIVVTINEEMRQRDLKESERSISYLTEQISKTNVADVKTMLFSLIEEQTKNIMLANVRDEYVLSTVDPAQVSEMKSEPKRAVMVILAMLSGFFASLMLVVVRYFFKCKL
jgi:uncharacterized protein involved in exopolysaccharide biosynthesis